MKPDPSEVIMSVTDSIQVESNEERNDDHESDTFENSSEPSSKGHTAIQMEPNDKDKSPTRQRQQPKKVIEEKKKKWDVCFLLLTCLLALVVASCIIGGIYNFGNHPMKCFPHQTYKWLKDEPKTVCSTSEFQNSLFNGLVTHSRMYSICDRIEKQGRHLRNDDGVVYFRTPSDEELFDKIIRAHMGEIFGGLPSYKKLMWTGFKFEWNSVSHQWDWNSPENGTEKYRNFCDKTDWEAELRNRPSDSDKSDIFIVKDFGRPDACWQAYSTIELADIMAQPKGTIPRLSFACESKKSNSTSGRDAMPGYFYPNYHKRNKYWVYGVSATIEDAKSECETKDSTLVTIDSLDKLNEVEHYVLWDTQNYTEFDSFWTGGYMNVSDTSTRNFKWHGSTVVTPYAGELFANITSNDLNAAIQKLNSSIGSLNKNQLRDCGYPDYLYLGLYHPRVEDKTGRENGERGLTILNPDGSLDHDRTNFYVLCEKKQR